MRTTTDIVSCVASEMEISTREAHSLVVKTFDAIADALAAGERVSIVRFGTFRLKHISAHVVKMPFRGKNAFVTERDCPMWTPSKRLRERVNGTTGRPGDKATG